MSQLETTADGVLRDRDAVDPELLRLPAPPQGRRTLALVMMALVAVASMSLAFAIRHDIGYFLSSGETVELGDIRELDPATLTPNTTVRVQGAPMMSRAVRYRRVLTGASHVVFPLAGQRTVYVEVDDDPAAIARTEFTGRLATFRQLGSRADAVEAQLERLGLPVSGESFVILVDESPSGSAWALMLAVFCALVVLLDLFLILRWFRPLPALAGAESGEGSSPDLGADGEEPSEAGDADDPAP